MIHSYSWGEVTVSLILNAYSLARTHSMCFHPKSLQRLLLYCKLRAVMRYFYTRYTQIYLPCFFQKAVKIGFDFFPPDTLLFEKGRVLLGLAASSVHTAVHSLLKKKSYE